MSTGRMLPVNFTSQTRLEPTSPPTLGETATVSPEVRTFGSLSNRDRRTAAKVAIDPRGFSSRVEFLRAVQDAIGDGDKFSDEKLQAQDDGRRRDWALNVMRRPAETSWRVLDDMEDDRAVHTIGRGLGLPGWTPLPEIRAEFERRRSPEYVELQRENIRQVLKEFADDEGYTPAVKDMEQALIDVLEKSSRVTWDDAVLNAGKS